jgi:hypothetical protein
MVTGTFATAAVGYLFAANRPEIVLRSSIAYGVTWVVSAAALLPAVGGVGVGIGWILGAGAESAVLVPAVRRLAGARIAIALLAPLSVAVIGGAVGWIVTTQIGTTLVAGAVGALAAALTTIGGLLMFSRDVMLDLLTIGLRSARDAFRRDPS